MGTIKSTNGLYPLPVHATRWVGIIFFLVIHIVGIIGTPLYVWYYGFDPAEWIAFFVFVSLAGMAITMGYHRLFAHVTFRASPVIRCLLLFFGASTFEQSALKWASQHRQHHQFTDSDKDPYTIKKGFWYAHMGWIIFWKHKVNYDNVLDLRKSRLVLNQHKWYTLWSVGSGMVLPLLIGFALGRPLGGFVLLICLRLVIVMNSAFFINSFAHTFGSRPFDPTISARDHWTGAFLTNGEGYHNFHHAYPNDYRNGIRWFHWDPTKWTIYVLSKLGLVWDLKRTPAYRLPS